MLSLDQPFVIFDDARQNGSTGRTYHKLRDQIFLKKAEDIYTLPDRLRAALNDGLHVAGYLSYEAGLLLEQRTAHLLSNNEALGWFGLFDGYDAEAVVPSMHSDPQIKTAPKISQKQYYAAFKQIQDYIRNGDIYQANLTFCCDGEFTGDIFNLYSHLRARALAGYGGIINSCDQQILSFSPELFFTLKDGVVTARPMKGTSSILPDKAQNDAAKITLQNDPKQRAENLMIVDLLRNDLSKICDPSSVAVPSLFHIESYPTVHQMTSTITGKLQKPYDAIDVLMQIFPCGSITGAPKIRAMEIIDSVEHHIRGAYCGSMGWIDPNGNAAFNVAIRTLSMQHDSQQFSFGLGSGVVADSNIDDEWAECLAKGAFISGT